MKVIFVLILLISTNVFAQNAKNNENPPNKEARKSRVPVLLPNNYEIVFKISTRFQGDTIFVDNKNPQTVPVSITMFDIQFLNRLPLFGILRVFVQTPIIANSLEEQQNDPFLKNLNNTSIGIGGGGNWYVYSNRYKNPNKWFGILLSFFGYFNLGVANSTLKDGQYASNIGAEINLRFEHYVKNHFGILYGVDVGFSTLHYREVDASGEMSTIATASFYYGATIGFMF